MRDGYPAEGEERKCECRSDNAVVQVMGGDQFEIEMSGFMQVQAGDAFLESERATVPLKITGHKTKGGGDGIGRMELSHDFDRPAPESRLQEIEPGEGFPATQEMHVNIKITLDQMPGITLRNMAVGTLRNSRQDSWPPHDARYDLQEPIDLENADAPGTAVARILSYTAHINPPE